MGRATQSSTASWLGAGQTRARQRRPCGVGRAGAHRAGRSGAGFEPPEAASSHKRADGATRDGPPGQGRQRRPRRGVQFAGRHQHHRARPEELGDRAIKSRSSRAAARPSCASAPVAESRVGSRRTPSGEGPGARGRARCGPRHQRRRDGGGTSPSTTTTRGSRRRYPRTRRERRRQERTNKSTSLAWPGGATGTFYAFGRFHARSRGLTLKVVLTGQQRAAGRPRWWRTRRSLAPAARNSASWRGQDLVTWRADGRRQEAVGPVTFHPLPDASGPSRRQGQRGARGGRASRRAQLT